MKSEICWVDIEGPGRLAIMPRPLGGESLDDEIRELREEGVSVLVSLLTEGEADVYGLGEEERRCAERGLRFLSFPIPDGGIPSSDESARTLVEHLAENVREGRSVAIHCMGGIGRSSTIAACVLLLLGVSVDDVFDLLREARGWPVPETARQRQWVEAFAEALGE